MLYDRSECRRYIEPMKPAFDALSGLDGELLATGRELLVQIIYTSAARGLGGGQPPPEGVRIDNRSSSPERIQPLIDAIGDKLGDVARAAYEIGWDARSVDNPLRFFEDCVAMIVEIQGGDVQGYRQMNRDTSRHPISPLLSLGLAARRLNIW